MHLVKRVEELLCNPEIFRRFTASPYIYVTRPLYEIMEIPATLLGVEDRVGFPFVRVVRAWRLRFRWRFASGRRCIVVDLREVGNIVLPDCIWKH
jgi:hypothetical protein